MVRDSMIQTAWGGYDERSGKDQKLATGNLFENRRTSLHSVMECLRERISFPEIGEAD